MPATMPPIRETPAHALLMTTSTNPASQTVFAEPKLATDNIQGSIIGGFNKSHRRLVSFRVNAVNQDRVVRFKRWLRGQSSFVATATEVIAFDRLFKATRDRRKAEGTVKSTWLSLSLSPRLLTQLTGTAQFADEAFTQGLAARSGTLGDPQEGPFAPPNWLVGGPQNEADLFAIIESDNPADLYSETSRFLASIAEINVIKDGGPLLVEILFIDEGQNLPDPLAGHEHFGFLDGISQPGLRGLLSSDPTDVLTLRQNPAKRDQPLNPSVPASPDNLIQPAQGIPGQDLLYPGEFVFGYPRQNRVAAQDADGPNPFPGPDSLLHDPVHQNIPAAPAWAQDGSFHVYRRLRQDVGAFHSFLSQTAKTHGIADPANATAARLVGSRLVGRWPSGAPVEREPDKENIALGNTDCNNNNFEFQDGADPIPKIAGDDSACVDIRFPRSVEDKDGARCPFSAHIRKSYPRDDTSTSVSELQEADTQTHRLLRRGLPYGPVSNSTPDVPDTEGDQVDRGLQFLCFQTSIENQFEFVIKAWVNNENFKEPFNSSPSGVPSNQGGGHDPILGQSSAPDRKRNFTISITQPDGTVRAIQLETTADWVHPTAGGYFFTPSISALQGELTQV